MHKTEHERNLQSAIAELESFGLPLRVINLLEDKLGLIWLDDLLQYSAVELQEQVPNLGEKSVVRIIDSVNRFRNSVRSPAPLPPILPIGDPSPSSISGFGI